MLWENHEHHIQARSWFKNVSAFATCPVVELGLARVSSHPLLGYGLMPELAFGVLRQFIADPRHEFIPDDFELCRPRGADGTDGQRESNHRPLSRRASEVLKACVSASIST